jgi:Cys-tRNA(Pro)/Cys-tRNA(Cys) deacylase
MVPVFYAGTMIFFFGVNIMAEIKPQKTNAMRILDRMKIPYTANYYTCDGFIDGIHIADLLGQPYAQSFKTLVSIGKSGKYHVFVLPVAEELDLKAAAKTVGEKSIELLHVKDLKDVTGYIRGGCTAIGMKKDYTVVIDESCFRFEEIIISGGALGVQIFISPENFMIAAKAKSADIVLPKTQKTARLG